MSAGGASETTRRNLQAAAAALPADDGQDSEDVTRGFVGRSEQRRITGADGRVVWDLDAYAFLDGSAPETAHPSLWRQGRLLAEDGLFEVVPGIYQLRGFDLSVMTVVEGEAGVIVIDPLISAETAAAALALYRGYRGDRPVSGMIYTHSHVDHFGGVKGVLDPGLVEAGTVPVVAPAGFLEHAVAENLFAGTAMSRRSGYMYGAALEKGPAGQIGAGLGQTSSAGTVTLIAPTVDITATGQELTVDGVRMVFQLTPGTEAPAEMNIWFPDRRALCAAENATHTMHNILTLRGAVVRDAHAWGHYLNETIGLWGDALDIVFASHHWPTWGRERALEFLSVQRDMYLYLHDQTLRMMNQGLVGAEIAERFEMPPALAAAWHTHGYYGSVSHNVKAIYQRYMGWYDGNPANLWAHPPVEAARRYVDAMGGADAALAVARDAFEEGDYRWVLEVCKHLLFTDDTDQAARALQADAMEQLAYGSENGTWRCIYLAGAKELRDGIFGSPVQSSGDFLDALTVPQLFDSLAVRVDGPRAWDLRLVISWILTDLGITYLTELQHGVLNHRTVDAPLPGSTVFTLTRRTLIGALTGQLDPATALADGTIAVTGDPTVAGRLFEVLAPVDPDFAIVTP
ncbi:alkyl sulfatase [Rhodococcus aetherivorans]|uniref:Alkyl sulfatase n=1 Tax=Rhodococcus aetherivorans TaxID=191292 RepID=A0ABQ0YP05_9NOCA|nr:alkyl sulfatase dimerization domain-containing protein [Rhodococcus aetherivorans]ETT25041.1 beta-lactamase domain protein [Rhodococcus rhodochrous ATCC 21198]KDE13512.1 alkyl sulfatase [Rhodococcus aetherivorans]NGP24467.1 MBL fold metallo-hydrolase [Rhodococcus aetherivorans]GES38248.1 alkyl sulfatase [Rhodococcus aetherivorans]